MDTVWIQYGYSMDTVWIQYGYSMDSLWIHYGSIPSKSAVLTLL